MLSFLGSEHGSRRISFISLSCCGISFSPTVFVLFCFGFFFFFFGFFLVGDIVNIMRELWLLRDVTMHCTAQSRGVCAPTPIHPLGLVVVLRGLQRQVKRNVLTFRKETVICNTTHFHGNYNVPLPLLWITSVCMCCCDTVPCSGVLLQVTAFH